MNVLSSYDPDEGMRTHVKDWDKVKNCRRIIFAYKLSAGFPKDDKMWDKHFFRIYMPWAKKMLDYLGNWQDACNCIQETMEMIREWNPEATISLQKIYTNHMANWDLKRKEKLKVL